MDLFRKTLKLVEQALKDANVKKEDIYDVSHDTVTLRVE